LLTILTVRSNTSWRSLLMRAAGFAPRPREAGTLHYSVSFLDYLGIAKYGTFVATSKEDNDSELPNKLLRALTLQTNDIISAGIQFEGDILEKWAKHIMCAHINLKQARNEKETLEKDHSSYQARLDGKLKPRALYEADIPICAILSALHKLVQEYRAGKTEPLVEFSTAFEGSKEKKWYQKLQVRQKTEATFEFVPKEKNDTIIGSLENSSTTRAHESSLPDGELKIEGKNLIFTRDFHLLMGRAHEMPRSAPPSGIKRGVQKVKSKFKIRSDEIPPCQKCFEIWEQETLPG